MSWVVIVTAVVAAFARLGKQLYRRWLPFRLLYRASELTTGTTQERIDEEVRKLVDEGYETAKQILTEKNEDLVRLAEGLLESLAIVTTNYGTGRSVAWIEGDTDLIWQRGQLRRSGRWGGRSRPAPEPARRSSWPPSAALATTERPRPG